MPLLKSAKKALRQSIRRKKRNDLVKVRIKNAVKKAEKSVSVSPEDLKKSLSEAFKSIDKSSKAGIISKNKASRIKSRLSKLSSKN